MMNFNCRLSPENSHRAGMIRESPPSPKSIKAEIRSDQSQKKLCKYHRESQNCKKVGYSFEEIKSMETLPTYQSLAYSKASIHENSKDLVKKYRDTVGMASQKVIGSQKVVKKVLKPMGLKKYPSSKQYNIYSKQYIHSNSHLNNTSHDNTHAPNLLEENIQLRAKILDMEMKQRDYVEKVVTLEHTCAQLQEIVGKNGRVQSREKYFIRAMRGMFRDMFAVNGVKGIWKKQKAIVGEWVQYKVKQENNVSSVKNIKQNPEQSSLFSNKAEKYSNKPIQKQPFPRKNKSLL